MFFFFPTEAPTDTDNCARCGTKRNGRSWNSGPANSDWADKTLCGICLLEVLQKRRNAELRAERETVPTN
jgi:hypothetical protein